MIPRRGSRGFTLVELTVAVVIIGILSAIAIPVYMNQRKVAWRGQVESDVRAAAVATTTAIAANGGVVAGLTVSADPMTGDNGGGSISSVNYGTPKDVPVSSGDSVSIRFSGTRDYTIVGTNAKLKGSGTTYVYTSTSGTGAWGDPPAPVVASSWSGSANASSSVLTEDGRTIATNLFPNPWGTAAGTQPNQIYDAAAIVAGWASRPAFAMNMKSGSTIGPFVMYILNVPANKQMKLNVEVGGATAGVMRGPAVAITKSDDSTVLAQVNNTNNYVPERMVNLTFTAPADGIIHLKFRGTTTQTVAFYDTFLGTATDAAAMSSAGVSWFGGTTVIKQ